MTSRAIAREIVDNLFKDFSDRRGLRQAWDSIDRKIQDEILITWIDIVEKTILSSGVKALSEFMSET